MLGLQVGMAGTPALGLASLRDSCQSSVKCKHITCTPAPNVGQHLPFSKTYKPLAWQKNARLSALSFGCHVTPTSVSLSACSSRQRRGTRQLRLAPVRCSAENENKEGEKRGGASVSTVTEEREKDERGEEGGGPSEGQLGANGGTSEGTSEPKDLPAKNLQFDSYSVLELLGPEKVDQEDVKLLKEKVFGYTSFWVTGQEAFGDSGEGVLLLGNLRGQREEVFEKLQKGMKELFGEKYDLFMVEEPNAEGEDPRGGPRVSFVLLRKDVSRAGPTSVWQYIICILLALVTAGACLELGLASEISRLPPDVVKYFTSPNPDSLEPPDIELLVPFIQSALPVAYGVFGVQVFHEIGHRLAAARYGVKMGLPYLVPNITVGSFGAVTQLKSVCPDRTAKFDISVAGPLAGAALSLAMLGIGLVLSASPEGRGDLVQVPSLLFQGSLLMGVASRAVLGYEVMHAATVGIHPLVIAGWCGLTTTAFNMLPVGCLDGGRCMQAAFGKMSLNITGLVTYLLLGLGVLGGTLALPWGLYILIVQRTQEKPSLNDVTGVGGFRQGALVTAVTLAVFTLLPIWETLAEDLGIGLGAPLL